MSADQPLTGDELATIKARAEAATHRGWRATAELLAGVTPQTTLRLVAEIERLRAAREECERQFQAKVAALTFAQGSIDDLSAQVERLEEELS